MLKLVAGTRREARLPCSGPSCQLYDECIEALRRGYQFRFAVATDGTASVAVMRLDMSPDPLYVTLGAGLHEAMQAAVLGTGLHV